MTVGSVTEMSFVAGPPCLTGPTSATLTALGSVTAASTVQKLFRNQASWFGMNVFTLVCSFEYMDKIIKRVYEM